MKVSDLTVEELETIIHRAVEDELEDFYFVLDSQLRAKIEEGLKDIREGRVISIDKLIARRKATGGKYNILCKHCQNLTRQDFGKKY